MRRKNNKGDAQNIAAVSPLKCVQCRFNSRCRIAYSKFTFCPRQNSPRSGERMVFEPLRLNLLDTIYCLASLMTDCNDATITQENLGYQIQEVVKIIIERLQIDDFSAIEKVKELVQKLEAAA